VNWSKLTRILNFDEYQGIIPPDNPVSLILPLDNSTSPFFSIYLSNLEITSLEVTKSSEISLCEL